MTSFRFMIIYGHQTGKCCKIVYAVWDIPVWNCPLLNLITLIDCHNYICLFSELVYLYITQIEKVIFYNLTFLIQPSRWICKKNKARSRKESGYNSKFIFFFFCSSNVDNFFPYSYISEMSEISSQCMFILYMLFELLNILHLSCHNSTLLDCSGPWPTGF